MFSKTLKTTYLQTLFYSFLNILLKQKVEKRNSSTEFLEDLHIQSIAILMGIGVGNFCIGDIDDMIFA